MVWSFLKLAYLLADDTPEKMEDTNRFWMEVVKEKYDIYISPVVIDELERCHEPKRSHMFGKLEQVQLKILERTDEVSALAKEYITGGVLCHQQCY